LSRHHRPRLCPWASVAERPIALPPAEGSAPWQITTTKNCSCIPFAKLAAAKLIDPPPHSSIQETARLFAFSAAPVADLFGAEMIKAASVGGLICFRRLIVVRKGKHEVATPLRKFLIQPVHEYSPIGGILHEHKHGGQMFF
jgi:hypothetical protein